MPPLVTVIMNCYNGARYLRAAIDSVLGQTYPHWEIVFLDNASTDESAEIARSYGEGVRYFKNDTTHPLGKARNQALAHADGEYIGFLDTDDVWMPEKLERQVAVMEANDAVGLVFSDVVNFEQDSGMSYTVFAAMGRRPPRGRIFPYLLRRYGISFPSALVRKNAIAGMPYWFDEEYKHSTDYDLFLRIAYAWECDYLDAPLAVYRLHASFGQTLRAHEPLERERTLQKLAEEHPEFRETYANILRECHANIAVMKARRLWQEGKPAEARRLLHPYLTMSRIALIYGATILPHAIVTRIWNRVQTLRLLVRGTPRETFRPQRYGLPEYVCG